MAVFSFFFSPSGAIGRLQWWVGTMLTGAVILTCLGGLFVVWQDANNLHDPDRSLHILQVWINEPPTQQQADTKVFGHRLAPYLTMVLILEAANLLALYSYLMIEIKRWHDRGMSGYWVLLHLAVLGCFLVAPQLGAYAPVGMTASGVISLFRLVNLGFLPGGYYPATQRTSTSGRYATTYGPAGAGALVLIFALRIGFVIYLHPSLLRSLEGHTLSAHEVSDSAPAALAANEDRSAGGKPVQTASYTKTTLNLGGQSYTGISQVLLVDQTVTILYDGGGKSFPASEIPRAFLEQWQIPAEKLDAAYSQ